MQDEFGQFISLRALAEHPHFREPCATLPSFQEIKREWPELLHAGDPQTAKRLFISHRWDAPGHPDPRGWQLKALRELGWHYNYRDPALCFWYDYMSLPQKPRTPSEDAIFATGLLNIRRLVGSCANVSLVSASGRDHEDDLAALKQRGWIVVELYIARRHMKLSLPLFEREGRKVEFGRHGYRSWDSVVPELSTAVPTDSADLILHWFRRRGIACTNGSDLELLAELLHEELSRFEEPLPAVSLVPGEDLEMTDEEIAKYGFINGSHISHRVPRVFVEGLRREADEKGDSRWRGKVRYRPELPQLDAWTSATADTHQAYFVDRRTKQSPMYPGVRFEFARRNGVPMVRISLD